MRSLLLIVVLIAVAGAGVQAQMIVKPGDKVAIVGDSITEQRIYSVYIEDYLLACVPQLNASVMQFGWGGEQSSGFAARMENDLLPYHPNVVTTCYGMNDGWYKAYEPVIGETYEKWMTQIVSRLRDERVRVIVGSPGVVDSDTAGGGNKEFAKTYNDNLAHLRDIDKKLATDYGMTFANVHDAMMKTMVDAKAVLGPTYHVAGGDGVHPSANGQLVMAYAFLKAMGFDGDIGTITIDMKGKATATDGHKVVSMSGGKVELESTRYPFCFYGDEKSPDNTRSILPYVPFNQDLNRLTLIVRNLKSTKAQITWGTLTKEFTRADLEKGINLAAEFLDNPFSEPFKKVNEAVAGKQGYETWAIKEMITRFRTVRDLVPNDPDIEKGTTLVRDRMLARQAALQEQARATVTPVKHTIVVKAE
jgi:lysophospholipase L1-like esterase